MVQAIGAYKLEETAAPRAALGPRSWARARGPALGRFALGWVVPLSLLGVWTLAAERGWAPPQILPQPRLVLDAIIDLAKSGDLLMNYGISLGRVAAGFAVGSVIGALLGAAMGLSRTV